MRDHLVLREGELVAWQSENWKIVHIEDMERVLASRVRDGRHEFLSIAGLLPAIVSTETGDGGLEPSSAHARRLANRRPRDTHSTESLTQREVEARERTIEEFHDALKIIKCPRAERRVLIRDLCKKFGYNQATAYRRVSIVELHGTADSLLRSVRADAGSSRIHPEVQEVIRTHLRKYRFVPESRSLPDILEYINGYCRKNGLKEISLSTLNKFEKETTFKQKLEAQGRKKQAADTFRPKVGHLPNNDYPLAIVQVDHTPTQICFVDEEDRQPIGDAWLSLVIDTYSRMVLGFYLTFDAPSTLSTGLALAHAFLPKEDYLRSLGIEGDWPCWGFPDVILVDNAVELNGHMMHGARRKYRFTLRDRPVGSPNFGGHVESAFKTFMYEFKSVPGTKFSNPAERAEYDSEGKAIFTISEFERFFTEFLVNDYHLGKHTGVGMEGTVPLLRWMKGIFEGDVMPPVGLPDRPTDPLALRISLMPMERRVVRNSIVSLFDEDYHSGALTLLSDTVDPTKPLVERKFEIRYDPRNIAKTWLYNDTTESYIELSFADLRKGDISLWENRARKRRREDLSTQFADHRYESKLRRDDMKEKAAKKTKQQRLEDEKARLRATSALVTAQRPPGKPKPSSTKATLDPKVLEELRKKVRAAPLPLKKEKEPGDEG